MSQETQENQGQNLSEQYLKHFQITTEDIRQHISGPIFSVAFHILLVILLAFVVIGTGGNEETVTVQMKEVEVVQPPEPIEEEPPPIENLDLSSSDDLPPGPAADVIGSTNVNLAVTDVIASEVVNDVDIQSPLFITFSNSALKLPGAMGARTKGGIANGLKNFGGTGAGENAVLKALRWLKKVQNSDGSWGRSERNNPNTSPALTGLATLTFLAHGETPESKEFGECVERALRKLCDYANQLCDQSNHSELKPGAGTDGNNAIFPSYIFPIVCYAVSEGYAMTKIPDLETAMDRMIRRIISGQNPLGGYEYNFTIKALGNGYKQNLIKDNVGIYGNQYRCDLSVGGWVFQAMKAAFAAGCKVEGLHEAMEKGISSITSVNRGRESNSGLNFTYENSFGKNDGNVAMTSIAVLSMNLLGHPTMEEAKKGLRYLENYGWTGNDSGKLTMDWRNSDTGKAGHAALYTWYYYTQAIFQGNKGAGSEWSKWNNSFNPVLVKEQDREGFWDTPRVKYGSDNSEGGNYENSDRLGSQLSHRVYATCMCTMMLEVYYRLLPTFQTVASDTTSSSSSGKFAVDGENDDDISL